MQAFVHFSIGVSGMLLLLLFVDLDNRREFLLAFASGFWAMIPDLGWVLLRVNLPTAATIWKSVFNSAFGNVFWFHPIIDAAESGNKLLEMTASFVLLAFVVGVYYRANDWE